MEGNDEVARLAGSFNRAAERIEQLVGSQKSLLANVSHELRTPLARLRVAIELLSGDERPELRRRIERDIEELDALIGELLLASRLDAGVEIERQEDVDLLALLAEEAVHTGAEVSGGGDLVKRRPPHAAAPGAQPARERPPSWRRHARARPGLEELR